MILYGYVDESNEETLLYEGNEITFYTNNTIVIESTLPENFPLYVSNTIELHLKNMEGKIVNKSGYIDFSISYPTFQVRGYDYEESYIGRYKVNKGICRFNFTLTEDYPWSDETSYFYIYFKFKYLNPANNKTYGLMHSTIPMYGDEIFMDDNLPYKISSGETINIQFVGINNYEDSKLLIYANKKYIGSTEFTDHEHYTISFKYKIPEDFVGNLNIFAKRITKTGFNTSCIYSYNISVFKNTKINGVNITSNAGKKITFKGNVTDTKGKPIKTGRIAIKLNGKTIKSDIYLNKTNKFNYTYKIPEKFTSKQYKITYTYVGNKKYARSEANRILLITKKETKIISNNISAYLNQKISIKGKIQDNKGKAIKTGNVTITLNKKIIKSDITLNNGTFQYNYKIPTTLKTGKYQITITYKGGKQLQQSNTTTTLTVKDYTTKIQTKNFKAKKGKTIKLTATIKDSKGKIKTGKATFKINNKIIGTSKIINGIASINYNIPKNYHGNYTLEILAKGTYTNLNKTITKLNVY